MFKLINLKTLMLKLLGGLVQFLHQKLKKWLQWEKIELKKEGGMNLLG